MSQLTSMLGMMLIREKLLIIIKIRLIAKMSISLKKTLGMRIKERMLEIHREVSKKSTIIMRMILMKKL